MAGTGTLGPAERARAAEFIRASLPLAEVPGTGVRLHLAGPRSGLSRLVPPGGAPYWAHAWPGGAALAQHIAAHPELVVGQTVLDLGTGSGLVAIAAARAGGWVTALDVDPLAEVAARLNAEANGVADRLIDVVVGQANHPLPIWPASTLTGRPIILAGDVFYAADVAARTIASFDAQAPRTLILIGDVGRRHLPRGRLEPLAAYPVRDVGDPASAPSRDGWVFRWRPSGEGAR